MTAIEPLSFQEKDQSPVILTVPGLGNSGPTHWQTIWERERESCERVELGLWNAPNRTSWVNKLNLAIHRAGRPVILVAHSLGCLAVAWWTKYERPAYGDPVIGALLVAPPEVDVSPVDARLLAFAPTPMIHLPFPSILVASRNDPFLSLPRAYRLAGLWGSELVDIGAAGHINAESNLGGWAFGQSLLDKLVKRADPSHGPAPWKQHAISTEEGAFAGQ